MDINSYTQILVSSRKLRNEYEVSNFEKAIVSILNMNEVEHIKFLCLGFDDATEHDEVMFSLVHTIESYDSTFGVSKSLQYLTVSIPSMIPHAREWLITIHKRILNNDSSRKMYAKVISNSDNMTKSIVLQLIQEIKEKNPTKFGSSVSEFLFKVGEVKFDDLE